MKVRCPRCSDCELLVTVQGPRPENILFLVHEVFEGLISESFQGVTYDYMLPCPDCQQFVSTKHSRYNLLLKRYSHRVRQCMQIQSDNSMSTMFITKHYCNSVNKYTSYQCTSNCTSLQLFILFSYYVCKNRS